MKTFREFMEDARVEINATSGSTDNLRTPGSSTKKRINVYKESEDLQEISKKRLGDYMDKARERVKTRSGESSQQQKNIDKAAHGIDRARHNYERSNQRAAAYQAVSKKEKIDAEIVKRKQGIMKAAKKFNKKKTGE